MTVKVLVADDEPTTRLIAQNALGSLGHETVTVTDGVEAWEAYRAQRPDVVISDWMMPGLTGTQLCRNIRAQPSGDYAYFIMISVRDSPEEIREGMQAGADDFLVKPLDPIELQIRLIAAARVTKLHSELAQQKEQLERLNFELTNAVLKDPLTGLGNRRSMQQDLELLDAQANRYGHGYCMALLDVDNFKSYNDTYGHQAGDRALQAVASQLRYHARTGDAIYRYGGEEFLCVFPEQSAVTGTQAVERMRVGLQKLAITHAGRPDGILTMSAGLSILDPEHVRPASDVLKEADAALYRAKEYGRDRIEHADPPPATAAAVRRTS
jgi:two-component system, cell cycle response regulator